MPDGALDVPNPLQSLFAEQPQSVPCSFVECTEGHRWPPTPALVLCPEDKSPVLALQQQNCPYCNEPIARISLRVDLVPRGAGMPARCKGQKPFGESIDVILQPTKRFELESKQLGLFAERA